MKKTFNTIAVCYLIFTCFFFLNVEAKKFKNTKSEKNQETPSSAGRRRYPKVYPNYPRQSLNNNNNPRPNNRRPSPIRPNRRPLPQGQAGRRPSQNNGRNKIYPNRNQTVPKKSKSPDNKNNNNNKVPPNKKTKSPADKKSPKSPDTATKTCRLCTSTFKVPSRRLILLDKKCSDWRQDDFSEGECRNIRATVSAHNSGIICNFLTFEIISAYLTLDFIALLPHSLSMCRHMIRLVQRVSVGMYQNWKRMECYPAEECCLMSQ
mmetsp:Transcript_17164/g.25636  ORF Transcript_17164/g.25636 Transcript_17164/m.25636 type:complete len:263 (+) Transcript_17164:1690-2478(+)